MSYQQGEVFVLWLLCQVTWLHG